MTNQTVEMLVQDSGNVERYTPSEIVEAARATMGSIDLDPASCPLANETVKAKRYFTKEMDGLAWDWYADTAFMNHPYGKGEKACGKKCTKKICAERKHHISEDIPGNEDWINKLVFSYRDGRVKQACALVFASTSEDWIEPLLNFPVCFIHGRVLHPTPFTIAAGIKAKGGTKGSAVFYLGPNIDRFHLSFSKLGSVYVPYPATVGQARSVGFPI